MRDKKDSQLDEKELLSTCALRFDGWKYKEKSGFDQVAALNSFFATGNWNLTPLEQMTVFFLLQRGLSKWDLVYEAENGKFWRAYRSLFLLVASYEVPQEYCLEGYIEQWKQKYQPRIDECLRYIEQIHKSIKYDDNPSPVI